MLLNNLTTRRLRFRPLTVEDAPALREFFNDPLAVKYLFINVPLEDYLEAWLIREQQRYQNRGDGLFALEHLETGEFIGQCGLLWQELDGQEELEIGYHLLPKHWGQGYATEAAIACREFAFRQKLAPKLISLIHPDNVRSQAVAMRNGMEVLRHSTYKGIPVVIYGILAPDSQEK